MHKAKAEHFIRQDNGIHFQYACDFEDDYEGFPIEWMRHEVLQLESCGSWSVEHLYRCRCLDSLIHKKQKASDRSSKEREDGNVILRSDKVRDEMATNTRFMHEIVGIRGFTEGEYLGLRKALRSQFEQEDKHYVKTLNEFIYCIRFGYLSKHREGGVLSVSDGITLALNIYKRGKWNSPLSREILETLINRKRGNE